MRGGAVRLAGRCFGLTVATGMSAAVGAQTMQTGLLVSTGVSAESNPYNGTQSGGGGSVAATAELQPQARFRSATTTLDLNGLAQFRQFIRRYGLEDNYSGNAFLTSRLSDRLSLHASGSASYTQGGFNNFGRPGLSPLIGLDTVPVDGTAETTLPPVSLTDGSLTSGSPLLTDATILGLRTRTKFFAAGAGFNGQLSAQSQLSGDLNVRASRFKAGLLSDYDNAGGELRYSRTLNELSSVGLIGSVDRTNYRGTRVGDTVTKAALVSYDRRFSRGWAVSVAVGASFSDIRQLAGQPNANLTALTVRGRFCNQAEYGRICIGGQRSPQPAANGSVRVSNTLTADYARRLNENDSLSVSGSYARTEGARVLVQRFPAAEFLAGSVRYDHRLGERSTFFANGTAAKTYNSLAPSDVNLGVAAGLQIRFGGLR